MTWEIMAGGPSPWGDQSKHLARLRKPEFEKGYWEYKREFGTSADGVCISRSSTTPPASGGSSGCR